MKKVISTMLSMIILLTAFPFAEINSFAAASGDFSYSVLSEEEKTCEITDYTGSATDIIIPNKIGNYTVQSIGNVAFAMNTTLSSVIISDGIKKIGASAFQDCSALNNITLPDSIVDIQFQAFTNTGYYLNDANWEGDALYIGKNLIRYRAPSSSAVSYKVKEKTLTIGSYAFDSSNCYEIILPDGLRNISESAFYRSSLTKITIPHSVESIAENAFEMCNDALTIYGYTDTYAEAYANKNNIKFTIISNLSETETNCDLHLSVFLDSLESNGIEKTNYVDDGGFAIYPDKTTILNYRVIVGEQSYVEGVVKELNCYYDPNLKIIESDDYDVAITGSIVIDNVRYNKLTIKNVSLTNPNFRAEIHLKFETPFGYTNIFNNFYAEIGEGYGNYTDKDSIPGNALDNGIFNSTNEDDASAFLNEKSLIAYPYGLKYEINNASVKIIGYMENDNVNTLYIPSEINGNPVTDIENYAFGNSTASLNTIFIPSSVKNLLGHAFGNYSERTPSMKNVIISEGISWIGGGAFYNCTNLEYINLPSTVSSIRPMILSGNYYYGSFLSSGFNLYKEIPNPSIKDINVIEDSYAENYLRDIKYNEVATFSDLISYGKKIHTVHYDVSTNGGDWIATETRPASTGDDIDLTLKANKNGYQFIGWNTNPFATKGLSTIKMSDSDMVLYAIFEKTVSSISIATQPSKKTYYVGDSLDTSGLQLKLTYNDGSTETVSSGYTTSGFSSTTAGTKTVTVTYEGLTTTFNVTVNTPSIWLSQTSKTMTVGDTATLTATTTPSGQSVSWTSSNTSVASVSNGVVTAKAIGTAAITAKFTYNGKSYSKTCNITVNNVAKTLTSISISSNPTKLTYEIGESLNISGLKLKLNYSDGSSEIVSSGFTTSSFDSSTAGTKTITVSYSGKSTAFKVTVNASVIDENAPQITMNSVTTAAGKEIALDLMIKNNPGIAGLAVSLKYDESVLTLKEVKNGDLFSAFTAAKNYIWDESENVNSDGKLATFIFTVAEDACAGDYEIEIITRSCANIDLDDVELFPVNSIITVTDFLYGDANGDGEINMKDVVLLRKYMANFDYDTETSTVAIELGADANGDGQVNMKDVVLLRKYMANFDYDTGTSSVVLGPQ